MFCLLVGALLIIHFTNMFFNSDTRQSTYEIERVQTGDTYRSFPLNDPLAPRKCMQICLNEDECRAWNYVKIETSGSPGICQLKHEVKDPRYDINAISGIARH